MTELLPGHDRGDSCDDITDVIGKSQKRWNNCFSIKEPGLSFSDQYLKNGLRVAVKIEGPWSIKEASLFACIGFHSDVPEDTYAGMGEGGAYPAQAGNGKQNPMLVGVGEFVQCGQRRVPPLLSVVRFYLVDNQTAQRVGHGPLFRSLVEMGFYCLPIIPDWEVDLPFRTFRTQSGAITVVEGRSEVRYRITEYQAEIWAERLACELVGITAGFWVDLYDKRVIFPRYIPGTALEIADVMFGPVNLQAGR